MNYWKLFDQLFLEYNFSNFDIRNSIEQLSLELDNHNDEDEHRDRSNQRMILLLRRYHFGIDLKQKKT